jgi:hypothetical protein
MQGIPGLVEKVLTYQQRIYPMELIVKLRTHAPLRRGDFHFSIVEHGEVTPLHSIKSYKGVEIELHSFLISEVNGDK